MTVQSRRTQPSEAVRHFSLLPNEALLSIRDVSLLTARSRASIYRSICLGDLRSVKIGASRRICAGAVRQLIARQAGGEK